jgi:hypothetical protein
LALDEAIRSCLTLPAICAPEAAQLAEQALEQG